MEEAKIHMWKYLFVGKLCLLLKENDESISFVKKDIFFFSCWKSESKEERFLFMSSEIDLNNSVGRKSNNVQSDAKVCECIVFYELDRMSYQKKNRASMV